MLYRFYQRLHLNNGNHNRSAIPGTVEFTEENILPGRKPQLPADDRDGFRGSYQSRLQMGVAVAVLGVVAPYTPGDQLLSYCYKHRLGDIETNYTNISGCENHAKYIITI